MESLDKRIEYTEKRIKKLVKESTDIMIDKNSQRGDAWRLPLIGLGFEGLLLVASLVVTLLAYLILQRDPGVLAQVVEGLGIAEMPALVEAMLDRRLTGSWTSVVLGLVLGAGTVLLLREGRKGRRFCLDHNVVLYSCGFVRLVDK